MLSLCLRLVPADEARLINAKPSKGPIMGACMTLKLQIAPQIMPILNAIIIGIQ